MPIRNEKSELINALLGVAAVSSLTLAILVAPNAIQLLDKPLQKYLKRLNVATRERELRQTLQYMQRQGLVRGHYDHGLEITDKAKRRLEKLDLDMLAVKSPKSWDHKWRIIFYDIPEKQKTARNIFGLRLRQLGCQQLQKSVWIHPFSCEEQINVIALSCNVSQCITYLEVGYINNQQALIKRFQHLGIK